MENQKLGLQQVIELMKGLKLVAVVAKQVAADGKVGIDDLQSLVTLAKSFDVILAAVKGVDQVVPELKDLDEAEVMQLIGEIFIIVKELKA